MKKSIWMIAIAIALVAMAGQAKAAVVFNLDTQFIGGGTVGTPGGPFGTVALTDSGLGVEFNINLNTGENPYLIGLNYGGPGGLTGWSVSSGYTLTLVSDGTGYYQWFDIKTEDASPAGNPMIFTLYKSATDLDPLWFKTKDENGVYYCVVRTYVVGAGESSNFYGSTSVPEPGTMMLLGSGLVGLAGWGRKRLKK